MGRFFSFDSPLVTFLSKAVDLVILNVLTILCCIPVVTIGAAVTALYTATGRMRREEGSLVRDYFRAFRTNFKQATVLWLVFLIIGALLAYSLYFYACMEMTGRLALMAVTVMLFLLWNLVLAWVFPLLSRFDNTVGRTLHNAVLCSVAYLPRSLAMAVLNAVPWLLLFYATFFFLQSGLLWFAIWFSLAAYLNQGLLSKPFDRLIEQTGGLA